MPILTHCFELDSVGISTCGNFHQWSQRYLYIASTLKTSLRVEIHSVQSLLAFHPWFSTQCFGPLQRWKFSTSASCHLFLQECFIEIWLKKGRKFLPSPWMTRTADKSTRQTSCRFFIFSPDVCKTVWKWKQSNVFILILHFQSPVNHLFR